MHITVLTHVAPLLFAAAVTEAKPLFANTTAPSTTSTASSSSSGFNIKDQTYTSGVTSAYYNADVGLNAWPAIRACSAIWSSSFDEWLTTAEVTIGPIVPATTVTKTVLPYVSSQDEATKTYSDPLSTWTTTIPEIVTTIPPIYITATSSAHGPLYYVESVVPFAASEPCCFRCSLYGGSVQVFFWPTQSELPSTSTLIDARPFPSPSTSVLANTTQAQSLLPSSSTLVNDAGFSFISPSIYVAFSSLYAADYCGDVGPRYAATTLAFSPGELSTSVGYWIGEPGQGWHVAVNAGYDISWTEARFGEAMDCGDHIYEFWNLGNSVYTKEKAALDAASSILGNFPLPGQNAEDLVSSNLWTWDPCRPTLSVPTQILTLDPAWNTCLPPFSAFFDPPYTLSAGNSLTAFGPISTPAAPVPTAIPVTADPTTTTSSSPIVTDPPVKLISDPTVGPPSSPTSVIQTVQILTPVQPTTPLPSPDPPATSVNDPGTVVVPVASNPVPSDPVATVPAAAAPTEADPTGPDPSQDPAGQSPAPTSSPPKDPSPNPPGQSQPTASPPTTGLAPNPAGQPPTSTSSPPPAVISIGSSIVTVDISSNFVFGNTQTLTPGGQITVSGTILSLASNGGNVIVDGTTTQALAVASQTPGIEYIISSQTLRPNGPAITVGGTVISLLPGASDVLIGTHTLELISATITASEANIGGLIMTIGGYVVQTVTQEAVTPVASGTGSGSDLNGTVPFLGGATRTNGERSLWGLGVLLGVGVLGVCWL